MLICMVSPVFLCVRIVIRMIKGILFDFDCTLSSRYEAAYWMYRDMMHQILPDMDPESIAFEAMVQDVLYWDQYGTVDKRYVLERFEEKYAPGMDIEKWRDYWYAHFHEFQIPAPHAREILEELQKKYRLGVVTNGNGVSQLAKLKVLDMEKYFPVRIASGDLGISKPDPRIFQIAAEQLGLPCSEIAFIGDNFQADIYGAVQAGMMPVWLCQERKTVSNWPVRKITEFEEIRQIFLEETE